MLSLRNLELSFGGIEALRRISFDAAPGQITGVIGPNGAGKTSLFNTISGLYRPDSGQVLLDGADITRLRPDRRAMLGVARTFQNIALFRGMSVLDNIRLGGHTRLRSGVLDALLWFGRARSEELALRARIEAQVIDFLELDHVRKVPVDALPYGLQKRVELGRALAMRPRLLMLDEPVAGMNREETGDMARFILEAQAEYGITILLVEHDMHLVMDLCAQVVVLNFGRQIANGPPGAVRTDPAVIEAYLGVAA